MPPAARGLPGLEGIPDHTFKPRDQMREMYAPPPPEIGEPITGDSTLVQGDNGWALWKRLVLCGVIAGFGILLTMNTDGGWQIALGIGTVIAAGVAWLGTSFSHTVSYVGRDGIARITLEGSRIGERKLSLLQFASAAGLTQSTTNHFRNGSYQHTSYNYNWTDRNGRAIYSITGTYNRDKIAVNDAINFANSAEIAWSQRHLGVCLQQLEREGSVPFTLEGGRIVRLGPGFMEFHGFQKDPVRVTVQEMKETSLQQGQFFFKHVDAKWWSGKGKFGFSYANMSNGRVFLAMLEKMTGVHV